MKMVKSLLLGSAAGVVAVVGAQAADLPVKAKPVEYVKICSLYGDGFYYIPGTDTCLRLGGYIMSDYYYGGASSGGPTKYFGVGGAQDRTGAQDWNTRHRANVSIDTRTQTAYGTLRTFTSLHFNNQTGTDVFNPQRAFIQFAGFTFGRTVSFRDTPGTMGDAYVGTLIRSDAHSETGANGINQISYTWDFGNGITLTGGSDERTNKSLTNLSNAGSIVVGAEPTTSRAQEVIPDEYLAFKVNQAWGQFGVSALAHLNNALNYTSTAGAIGYAPSAPCIAQSGTTFCNHPSDKWGFAILSGIWVNTPFGNGNQDHVGGFFNYGVGSGVSSTNMASPSWFGTGNQLALGWNSDGVYLNGGSIEQTTSWSTGAGYEHWFTPTFKVTPFGTATQISYDTAVVNNRLFCGGVAGGPTAGAQGFTVAATTKCDPGFMYFNAGMNAKWYPVKNLEFGVEGQWLGVQSAFNNQLVTVGKAVGNRPTGVYTAKDMSGFVGTFRAKRTF